MSRADFKDSLRALLYARTSKADGDQDPAVQLRTLREWAASRGWRVVGEESDMISGDPARRRGDPPGLRRALHALSERRADVIVVFAADRLVRSPTALLQLVARVQSLGAQVASYQDGADLDTTTDIGELMTFIRGWFSRMELRLLRARTNAGLADARARGVRFGRPVGMHRGRVLQPGEPGYAPNSATVREMRERGLSWGQIARQLQCTKSAAERAFKRLPENGGSTLAPSPVEMGGGQ